MNRNSIVQASMLGALLIAAPLPLQAQRKPTGLESAVIDTNAFLNAHPDLWFRLRGMELIKTREPGKAMVAFQRAALFADKPSQAYLAGMYWEGLGTRTDRALAYTWMDLAAERAYPDFIAMREKMWSELNETERNRVLVEGTTLYARYGDDAAIPRLDRELRRQRAQVVGSRKEPRSGRVEVGALKQDKPVPASRVKDKKDAPDKP